MSKISVFAALTVSHRESKFRGVAFGGKKTKTQKNKKRPKDKTTESNRKRKTEKERENV